MLFRNSSCRYCLCVCNLQIQARREELRQQTSRKLLLHSSHGPADHAAIDSSTAASLQAEDYEDLAVLAARLVAQQEESEHLSSQLVAANAKRSELAKVG